MSFNYEHELIDKAKELRKNMTREERKLWYCFLKMHPLKFQRQKTTGFYIADFYCAKARLVIELDGSQHYKHKNSEHDKARTKFLEENNIFVLRYTNKQITECFSTVCNDIDRVVNERIA